MPLDPLTALSVAASVIQFVEFSSQIVSKARHIYQSPHGILQGNYENETISIRLQSLAEGLKVPLKPKEDTAVTKQDQALQDICMECISLSDELLLRLDKLKVPSIAQQRRWKSCRQALKSVWSKKKLDAAAARLSQLRSELDSHVLYYLRSEISLISLRQDEGFKTLGEDSALIVEMLVQDRLTNRNHIAHQFEEFKLHQKAEHERTREYFINVDFQKRRQAAEKSLLQALKFKTMRDRLESITKAHRNTFEWIFKDPTEFDKPWDNFQEWLISGQGLYWIQGKAGSGKSTLMEFISTHSDTTSNLYNWSKGKYLRVGTFFFWNGGNPEQRSQAGLLRSLLFQVLSIETWLIPDVFPEEWEEYFRSPDSGFSEEWKLPRLKICFENLIRLTASNTNLQRSRGRQISKTVCPVIST